MNTCNICGKSADKPFRAYDEAGNISVGCVDDFHTSHLTPISKDSFWHNRPQAKQIRTAIKRKSAARKVVYSFASLPSPLEFN